jgi:hypothetical protein
LAIPADLIPDSVWPAGSQVLPVNLNVPLFSETAVNMSLTDLSATQAVDMLCNRDITAVQYASALLAKAQEYECINAWAEINPAKVCQVGFALMCGHRMCISALTCPRDTCRDAEDAFAHHSPQSLLYI